MKALVLALALTGCAATKPEAAPEPKPAGEFIAAAVLDTCKAEGGCVLISKERLRQFVLKYRADALKEAQAACWANTGADE